MHLEILNINEVLKDFSYAELKRRFIINGIILIIFLDNW